MNKSISKFKNSGILTIGFGLMLISCFDNPDRPSLRTIPLSVVSANKAISGIIINSDGGGDIIEKGICHSNLSPPTITNERIVVSDGGSIISVEVPIQKGSGRYYRAYAINGAGVSYGNEVSFSSVITNIDSFDDVTGTSASFKVVVQSDIEVLSRGICWSTAPDPTIENNKLDGGKGPGSFSISLTGLTIGTGYYVRPYATNREGIFYGDPVTFTTKNFPKVTTMPFVNEGTFIVASGTEVVDNGGFNNLTTGICWSIHPTPTLSDNKNYDVNRGNISYYEMPDLKPGLTYYVRAYATNEIGTSYGNERVITMPSADAFDLDGNPYSQVTIGTQIWMVENLRTTKYANGDNIPNINTYEERISTTSGGWNYRGNQVWYNHPFGKQYNWYALIDARNVCPTGWHTPSETEWTTLINYLGGNSVAGDKLKEAGNVHWAVDNQGATNSSRFTALPGGGEGVNSTNYFFGYAGYFWSATEYNANENFAWSYVLNKNSAIDKLIYPKQAGHTIRCMRD